MYYSYASQHFSLFINYVITRIEVYIYNPKMEIKI